MKYCVIDVGSNSVRMLLSENGKTIKKSARVTGLATGLAASGVLSEPYMQNTAAAIADFKAQGAAFGADKTYVFATAAVRQSLNSAEFIKKVKTVTGLDVDVIDGKTEARLGATGALGDSSGGVIDVGGGSAEVVVKRGDEIIYAHSIDTGAVRLTDAFSDDFSSLDGFLDKKLSEYGVVPEVKFYAVGGTATSLAAMDMELEPYDPKRVDGYVFKTSELKRISEKLLQTPLSEREKIKGLQKGRARIIASGARLLYRIAEYVRAEEITVKESDNLEGYLHEKVNAHE